MFVVELLDDVTGKIPFYKLVKNDKCQFDEFIDNLSMAGGMQLDIDGIWNIMNRISSNKEEDEIPLTMFKQLQGKEKAKDYEIKKR